jgi:hypothetical protein
MIKSFGDCGLNFVNTGMPICSPMKIERMLTGKPMGGQILVLGGFQFLFPKHE